MTAKPTLVIVGASLAGAKAAEGARAAGFEGRIVLVGEETAAPYERPPLSKAVLRGETDVTSARVHDEGFYVDNAIELIVDRATAIDGQSRKVGLSDGSHISYDTAVLATGLEPRPLSGPGADLHGVHYLRTADDAVRLRDAIRSSTRVAIIGSGWIGSEVAASARQMGADVVVIDPAPVPLHRVLGDEVGAVFRDLHAEHGVDLRFGVSVAELRGDKSVEQVVLSDGARIDADVVVAGIGAVPRTELVENVAGFTVDNGIVVDGHLETSVPGVYAAGDVANAWHPHYHRLMRVEHWSNALNQGTTAGRNAAGQSEIYARLPYFFSDQYDLGMEYVGHTDGDEAVAIRGELTSREFIAFWHRNGVVTAAMNVNVWDVVDDLRALVETRRVVDVGRLRDPDAALGKL